MSVQRVRQRQPIVFVVVSGLRLAAAEDHIAGCCAARTGVRRGDELCATKPVDRIGRTRQFTYWPGPRRAVAHKIRAHLSQAFTAAAAAAASVAVWLPAIWMGTYTVPIRICAHR